LSLNDNYQQKLREALETYGVAIDHHSEHSKNLSESVLQLYYLFLEYELFMSESLMECYEHRNHLHSLYEQLEEAIENRRNPPSSLLNIIVQETDEQKRMTLLRRRDEIQELEKHRENVSDVLLKYSQQIQVEFNNFQSQKNKDFPLIYLKFARLLKQYAEKELGVWESVYNKL
jgi:hypothetical protein